MECVLPAVQKKRGKSWSGTTTGHSVLDLEVLSGGGCGGGGGSSGGECGEGGVSVPRSMESPLPLPTGFTFSHSRTVKVRALLSRFGKLQHRARGFRITKC